MVLANARVIDGTGCAPLERTSVHSQDGRIVEVGAVDGPLPGGALDLEGRWAVADLLVPDGAPPADLDLQRDPERIWMVVQAGRVVAGRARILELAPA
jgi:imidazolonepropionase-like amidohydrolase